MLSPKFCSPIFGVSKVMAHEMICSQFRTSTLAMLWDPGLQYTFDPKASKGHRVTRLRYANGTALREDKELTVAMIDYFYAKSDPRREHIFWVDGLVNGEWCHSALLYILSIQPCRR